MATAPLKRTQKDANIPDAASEPVLSKRSKIIKETDQFPAQQSPSSRHNSPRPSPVSPPANSSNLPRATSDYSNHDSVRKHMSNQERSVGFQTGESSEEEEGGQRIKSDSLTDESAPEGTSSDGDFVSTSSSDSNPCSDSADSDADTSTNAKWATKRSLPRVPALRKPPIHHADNNGAQHLLQRISSFLPRIKEANDKLQRDIAEGRSDDVRLDNVADSCERGYIEMNLGLGVLEEKRSNDGDSPSSDSYDDLGSSGEWDQESRGSRESNILGKLMGRESTVRPTIEEVFNDSSQKHD